MEVKTFMWKQMFTIDNKNELHATCSYVLIIMIPFIWRKEVFSGNWQTNLFFDMVLLIPFWIQIRISWNPITRILYAKHNIVCSRNISKFTILFVKILLRLDTSLIGNKQRHRSWITLGMYTLFDNTNIQFVV